jgi:formylglycine-generating enzyme required for sulfatase activity
MKAELIAFVASSLFILLSVVATPSKAAAEANGWSEQTPAGMARIPAGVYVPLYKTSGAAGAVKIESFHLDLYPVTNAQFLEFVSANPSWRRSQAKRVFADTSYLRHWGGDLELGPQRDEIKNSPVSNVSWFAAMAYAKWRSKRLPTLAEWESAASASPNNPDGSLDAENNQRLLRWYSKPAWKVLPPVGSTFKNFWGIYDMHGLVWEWVSDFNTAFVTGDSRGDTGLERQLFCGGGSVNASDFQNYAAFMRHALRSSLRAGYCIPNVGFRCACDLRQKLKREGDQ